MSTNKQEGWREPSLGALYIEQFAAIAVSKVSEFPVRRSLGEALFAKPGMAAFIDSTKKIN